MASSTSGSLDREVGRARQGDRSALIRLMASCRSWLSRRARTRLPRGLARKLDGSDLFQDVQVRAIARFPEFQGRTARGFRAWMARIVDREVIRVTRFWRRKRRDWKREEPLSPVGGPQKDLAEIGTSILGRLSLEEELVRLRLAASWCREEDWTLIEMHLFEGRSHDEIAAEWRVTVAAVRQRFCRAVKRVKEAMQLQAEMTRRGIHGLQQDVIGLHLLQGADAGQIAHRLGQSEELVMRWIAEAQPLFRAIAKDEP